MSNTQFGFTTANLTSAQSMGQQSQASNFPNAPLSTFGQSGPAWKFQETYNTVPGSNFGPYVATFGVPRPGWIPNSR